jgi:hypothetical protein
MGFYAFACAVGHLDTPRQGVVPNPLKSNRNRGRWLHRFVTRATVHRPNIESVLAEFQTQNVRELSGSHSNRFVNDDRKPQ